jgi:ABC-type Mn2+/Zn2+ transport system permease subunit
MNRKVWIAIYVAAFIIFFGGYVARVYKTPYFPLFVGFCMLFALAVNIYWWRTHKIERRD